MRITRYNIIDHSPSGNNEGLRPDLSQTKEILADGEVALITVSYDQGVDVELFVDDKKGDRYKVTLSYQELVGAVKAQNQ